MRTRRLNEALSTGRRRQRMLLLGVVMRQSRERDRARAPNDSRKGNMPRVDTSCHADDQKVWAVGVPLLRGGRPGRPQWTHSSSRRQTSTDVVEIGVAERLAHIRVSIKDRLVDVMTLCQKLLDSPHIKTSRRASRLEAQRRQRRVIRCPLGSLFVRSKPFSSESYPLFLCNLSRTASCGQPCKRQNTAVPSTRRRERWLQWLRHERMTVAMVLCEAHHHTMSEPALLKKVVEAGTHSGPQAQGDRRRRGHRRTALNKDRRKAMWRSPRLSLRSAFRSRW